MPHQQAKIQITKEYLLANEREIREQEPSMMEVIHAIFQLHHVKVSHYLLVKAYREAGWACWPKVTTLQKRIKQAQHTRLTQRSKLNKLAESLLKTRQELGLEDPVMDDVLAELSLPPKVSSHVKNGSPTRGRPRKDVQATAIGTTTSDVV